jgi:PIN domain nuclease of toxin-antitoxin system
MKLLLDTHIWLWSYLEPHKISSQVASEVANPENDLFLSAASIWELVLLVEKRRLQLNDDLAEWCRKSKEELNLNEIPITWEVAQELRFTQSQNRDPGDRFLVATARLYDLTLVTSDRRLMTVQGISLLPNR